jgi:small basic protein
MIARPATTRITLAAGIASLVGPARAALPYTTNFTVFPNSFLGDIWLLAAIGAIGVGIGVFALCKGSKIAGTICLLTNIPVLAYYGFIAVFFATGGSR